VHRALVALSVVAATVSPWAQGTAEQQLLAAEREWAKAMVEGDVAALGAIYADDLTYVHGSGAVETKAVFLGKLGDGSRTYHRIETLEPRAHPLGDAGAVTDLLEVDVEAGGDRFTVRVRTINVFVRQDDRWKIVLHQATRLASP
jgi:ketosteroid isomerase-like protein